MSWGRGVATTSAIVAVAGCAALAVGMARASGPSPEAGAPAPTFTGESAIPAFPSGVTGRTSSAGPTASAGAPVPGLSSGGAASSVTAGSTPIAGPVVPPAAAVTAPASAPRAAAAPSVTHPAASAPRPAAAVGGPLPLSYSTSGANEVITVVASSTSSTTATLQAWNRVSNGWVRTGPSMTAHVGSDGLSTSPSESRSATPIGSFTLTQAFGALGNPGSGLPYFQTDYSDWWISAPGSQYNTHQHCGSCGYGPPDEQLRTETPYYNYAVVIDYNTPNAPGGVRPGAGSAFFLHVTDGTPTAGCVAIPQSNLVTILKWLTPGAHPRILIGVG